MKRGGSKIQLCISINILNILLNIKYYKIYANRLVLIEQMKLLTVYHVAIIIG